MYAKTITLAALALVASAAFANEEDKAIDTDIPSFSTLDTNGDGYVTKGEAESNDAVMDQWNAIDADANGTLSDTEYSEHLGGSDADDAEY
jgi:hypothetical protein